MSPQSPPLLTKNSHTAMTPESMFARYKKVLFCSHVHWLLAFVPLGILAQLLHWGPLAVFILNFLAIVPLAALLSLATEEISEHVGETIGGLLNATFGNAVELIVAVVALLRGEIRIVQTSMLGSILSNILLVLGCCFIAGGYNRIQQKFNMTVAQTMASLMALSVSSLFIPAAFNVGFPNDFAHILSLSRGTSLVLLTIYALYLIFQLRTHADYFEAQNAQIVNGADDDAATADLEANIGTHGSTSYGATDDANDQLLSPVTCGSHDTVNSNTEIFNLSTKESLALLTITTIVVTFCADYLVDSIDGLVSSTGISKTFIGIILIPIVGNAAEHATAVISAMKNKMDLAVGVAIGSSMQIALFMTPFLVILGWILGQPMSLLFSTFETCVLFISVLILNYIVSDGESNWLEGCMLFGTYMIISIAFFYTP